MSILRDIDEKAKPLYEATAGLDDVDVLGHLLDELSDEGRDEWCREELIFEKYLPIYGRTEEAYEAAEKEIEATMPRSVS